MTTPPSAPDTIVLIHGFWVTPRSWEHWKTHYEGRGFRVLTPPYPGFEGEVEALNAGPTPIAEVTLPAIVESLSELVRGLDRPPILLGHSAGGTIVQLLLDRGLGAVGVVLKLGADRGRDRGAAVAAALDLGGAREPGQPAPRRRADRGAVALRVHQHVRRRGVPGAPPALPRTGVGPDPVELGAGQPDARPAGRAGGLRERRAAAAAVRVRRRGPHHAAGGPAVERPALPRRHRDRGARVPRLRPPAARAGRLGADRRRGPRLGARPRHGPAAAGRRAVTDA
ncbi:alpha/beta fold hydrolase [Geodermatophilus amargosae]|uniref:alpha/beta hydrolase n=1 Tax=Geodermatophilus amargosae TaxID=1296565 RepID=UPI003CCBF852